MGEIDNILHQDDITKLLSEIRDVPDIQDIVVVYTTEGQKIGYQSIGNNSHIVGLLESAKHFYFQEFD